jgi:predicted NACHT family NTPase
MMKKRIKLLLKPKKKIKSEIVDNSVESYDDLDRIRNKVKKIPKKEEDNLDTNITKESNNEFEYDSNISNEQKNIIEALEKNHVMVNAVAGSGKTTTCLHIAKRYSSKKNITINLQ